MKGQLNKMAEDLEKTQLEIGRLAGKLAIKVKLGEMKPFSQVGLMGQGKDSECGVSRMNKCKKDE